MERGTVIFVIVVTLFVSACSQECDVCAPTPTHFAGIAEDYFPLSVGAYWVYEGLVQWEIGGKVEEKTLTWKMEVLEKVERYPITGYALRGHPSDLAWYEDGKERSDYAIIQVGPNKFYKTSAEKLQRLKDDADSCYDLVQESELMLDLPLFPEKRFGITEQITRIDGRYCWGVGQEKKVALSGIKGVSFSEETTAYTLYFFTLPDHVRLEFVPGIGITQYEYGHHGTVSVVDVKLVEYHPGDD
jgi:hypothetical protein